LSERSIAVISKPVREDQIIQPLVNDRIISPVAKKSLAAVFPTTMTLLSAAVAAEGT